MQLQYGDVDISVDRWARGCRLAREVAAGLIDPVSLSIGCSDDGHVVVHLDTTNRAALRTLAERLGELAADLWLDGKIDLDVG